MRDLISDLKELMQKHNATLQGQLLILPGYYPQEIELNEQAMWGSLPIKDRSALVFTPIVPEPAYEEITPIKNIHITSDIAGYTCPVTNNWVEGKTAHRENLKRQGCRVFEPGEREHYLKEKPKEIERNAEKAAHFFAERMAERL